MKQSSTVAVHPAPKKVDVVKAPRPGMKPPEATYGSSGLGLHISAGDVRSHVTTALGAGPD